jgi:purine/pyrimidine-nucleoside phosphorylase
MALLVNEYFGGKVKSIGFEGERGRATVGVMSPGTYEFSTTTVEVMTVIDGALTVRLPGAASPRVVRAGGSFEVGAGETFHLAVSDPTAYHCLYVA